MRSRRVPTLRLLCAGCLMTVLALLISACDDDSPSAISADISGRVRLLSGSAAVGATVYLGRQPMFFAVAAPTVLDSVRADPSGVYRLTNLDDGRYQVFAGAWDADGLGLTQVSPMSKAVDIAGKGAGAVTDLELRNVSLNGLLSGEVRFWDGAQDTVVDGAKVTLYRYRGGDLAVVDSATTDLDGRYAFDGVKTGNHVVGAYKSLPTASPDPRFWTGESGALFCDGLSAETAPPVYVTDDLVRKPAVYIYPSRAQEFTVRLKLAPGTQVTTSEPDYGDRWRVPVATSGRIDGRWDYLFYEVAIGRTPVIETGWCVPGDDLACELDEIVKRLGLNEAERDDFLAYWRAQLPPRRYFVVHAVSGDDLDVWVDLEVTPVPDSELRFWLFFRGSDEMVELPAPAVAPFTRQGTTLVEWGGTLLD